MFTGIVEELGTVLRRDPSRVRIGAGAVLSDARVGDSIAVNGCCLTVVEMGDGWWEADVSQETLDRTSLGDLAQGDPVNLERPVRLADRLGGHLVQGHVDAVGEVVEPALDLRVRLPGPLLRYVVEKGSVTVDGVSLTVVQPLPDGFTVALIPHTAAVTTLGSRRPGDRVNIEVDVIAKYTERLLAAHLAAPAGATPTDDTVVPADDTATPTDDTDLGPLDAPGPAPVGAGPAPSSTAASHEGRVP